MQQGNYLTPKRVTALLIAFSIMTAFIMLMIVLFPHTFGRQCYLGPHNSHIETSPWKWFCFIELLGLLIAPFIVGLHYKSWMLEHPICTQPALITRVTTFISNNSLFFLILIGFLVIKTAWYLSSLF